MPHLTIEYSANLPHYPEAETLTALNATLCAHPQVQDEADLKTRFIVADSFEIGIAPANRAFVHAQLRLLAGRTPEAKKELSERIAAVLRERTPKPQGVLVVCEGFATGASIHEATGHAVAVAFNAGNLLPVAQALPDLSPRLTDLPPAYYRAPLAATVWATAQSRAPPLAA